MNVWDNLSNAAHIDWVLETIKLSSASWNTGCGIEFHPYLTHDLISYHAPCKERISTLSEVLRSVINLLTDLPRTQVTINPTNNLIWKNSKLVLAALVISDNSGKHMDFCYNDLLVWSQVSGDPADFMLLPALHIRKLIETGK